MSDVEPSPEEQLEMAAMEALVRRKLHCSLTSRWLDIFRAGGCSLVATLARLAVDLSTENERLVLIAVEATNRAPPKPIRLEDLSYPIPNCSPEPMPETHWNVSAPDIAADVAMLREMFEKGIFTTLEPKWMSDPYIHYGNRDFWDRPVKFPVETPEQDGPTMHVPKSVMRKPIDMGGEKPAEEE